MAKRKKDEDKTENPEAAEETTTKEPTTYRVLIGSLIVGKGKTVKAGDTFKVSELPSEEQRRYFLNDGTIELVK